MNIAIQNTIIHGNEQSYNEMDEKYAEIQSDLITSRLKVREDQLEQKITRKTFICSDGSEYSNVFQAYMYEKIISGIRQQELDRLNMLESKPASDKIEKFFNRLYKFANTYWIKLDNDEDVIFINHLVPQNAYYEKVSEPGWYLMVCPEGKHEKTIFINENLFKEIFS